MKKKLSITVDAKMVKKIEQCLRSAMFRNRSHVVEVALEKMFEEQEK